MSWGHPGGLSSGGCLDPGTVKASTVSWYDVAIKRKEWDGKTEKNYMRKSKKHIAWMKQEVKCRTSENTHTRTTLKYDEFK
jgi:hypothetical protein